MGRFAESWRRTRLFSGWVSLVLASYLCGSLRLISAESGAIRQCSLSQTGPSRLGPGWHLAPPGLCRLIRYPSTTQRIDFDLPGNSSVAVTSQEGISTRVKGSVSYRLPPDSALKAYLTLGGHPLQEAVNALLRESLASEVRATSFAKISGAHRVELEASVSRSLGETLRTRGMILQSMRVDSVRMARQEESAKQDPIPGARLLLVGLDGADWRVIDPLLHAGRLPNLARLIQNGVRARLRSVEPLLSPVAWTSAATGFVPSEHGILDFLVRDTRSGEEVPVTSRHRKVKAVWNILSDSGVHVGIIGWWATWPAEYVDGYVVTDRMAYQLFRDFLPRDASAVGKTFPPELYDKLAPLMVTPEQISDRDLMPFLDPSGIGSSLHPERSSRVQEFKTVLASTRSYASILAALGSGGLQPFQAVYFEGIDTTSHLFMPFRPPLRPGVATSDFRRYSRAVDEFYVYQDSILGEILRRLDPGTGVLIISDHGFKSENDRPSRESRVNYASAASWHRRHGILIASSGWFGRSVELPEVSILDVAPTILAYFGLPIGEDMQGRPIPELFTPEFVRSHPIRYRASWETGRMASGTPMEDPAGDSALKARLRSLGYLSQEGSLTANNLGNALLAEGKPEEAIVELEKAVRQMPKLALTHVNLARALLAKGEVPRCRQELEQALRLDPGSTEAGVLLAHVEIAYGEIEKGVGRLQRVLSRDPSVGSAWRMLGNVHLSRGNLAGAKEDFEKALAVDPDDSESMNNLGIVYRQEGEPELAERQFERALDANPDFVQAYNNLALSALEREDYARSERLLERAAELAPRDPVVHNSRGNLMFRLGKARGAETAYRTAISLQPDYAEPHNGLGAALKEQGSRSEAEKEFREAARIRRGYADARLNLVTLLLEESRTVEAEREMRAFLRDSPGNAPISLHLAQILLEQGKPEEAIRICKPALERNPGDARLWRLKGDALFKSRSRREAAEAYRRSLEINSMQPDISAKLRTLGEGDSR